MKDKELRKIVERLASDLGYEVARDIDSDGCPLDMITIHNSDYNVIDRLGERTATLHVKIHALASALGYTFEEVEAQPSKIVAVKKGKK